MENDRLHKILKFYKTIEKTTRTSNEETPGPSLTWDQNRPTSGLLHESEINNIDNIIIIVVVDVNGCVGASLCQNKGRK